MKELRREFVKAWKGWRKARAIRAAMAKVGYGRAGPAKAWYDECTVVMRRARRAIMMELRKPEPSIYEWVDRGIQEGSAFMVIHPDGRCELLNSDDVFEKRKEPPSGWGWFYSRMAELQKGLPPGGLK